MPIVTKPLAPGERLAMEHTKGVFVPDTLHGLHGPTAGRHRLPLTLDWTPGNGYDLDDDREVKAMYEVVIREARSQEDVDNNLSLQLLTRAWRSLYLLPYVRQAWETRHPELLSR